jgi:hypothetical protein
MLTLYLVAVVTLFFLAINGSTVAAYTFNKTDIKAKDPTFILFSFSIISAFFISSLAVVWSFGVFGSDNYIFIYFLITILTSIIILKGNFRVVINTWKLVKLRSLFLLTLIPALPAVLSSTFAESATKIKTVVGVGQDTTQNMMAALMQREYGQTFSQAQSHFFNSVNETSSFGAYMHLWELPSMREQATVDYLIYGTRWGLTIPYAQILRIKNDLVISMQGLCSVIGLTLGIIVLIGLINILINKISSVFLISVSIISCSLTLYIVYNGGLAQLFALPASIGLIFTFLMIILFDYKEDHEIATLKVYKFLFFISIFSLMVTYTEALIVMAFWILISIILLLIFKQKASILNLIKNTKSLILIYILISIPFIIAVIPSVRIRLKGSAGTGFNFSLWPFPSEIFGIGNPWSVPLGIGIQRSSISILIGVLTTGYIAYLTIKNFLDKSLSQKRIAILVFASYFTIFFLSMNAILQGSKSNYIYVKSASYMLPLLIFAIYNAKTNKVKKIIDGNLLSYFILILILGSTAHYLLNIKKETQFSIFSKTAEIFYDPQAQIELANYNYLTVYRPSSSSYGVLGDIKWISKAPNDIDLAAVINNEIRVICNNGDPLCGVDKKIISDSALSKYGFSVYEVPYSTKEFSMLSPLERYNKTFELVGQTPFEVPKRFLGGNPLFTPEGK